MMLLFISTVLSILQFDNRTLDKNLIDFDTPPYTMPRNLVDAQLKVIPRILKFLADFTGNSDLIDIEHSVNYLNSLATYPYKAFEGRELISNLIKNQYQMDITRVDRYESMELLKEPEESISIVVGEYYLELRNTLEQMINRSAEGEQVYLLIKLSNSINNYLLIREHLKQVVE